MITEVGGPYCPYGEETLTCGPWCGQYDAIRNQCVHRTTAQALAGILALMREAENRRLQDAATRAAGGGYA